MMITIMSIVSLGCVAFATLNKRESKTFAGATYGSASNNPGWRNDYQSEEYDPRDNFGDLVDPYDGLRDDDNDGYCSGGY